ncbi:MAG: DUF3179 domain-containing protein [Chloroflexi bacterium]|nr:MAG: DUF3179 domain-containing protein [Chloroflexota bacterium]MBL1193981.1 DUF3179 domain-containing protein [Chloroflexota bacterium]NOH11275.1 DUF3179 domain-containing protein [Chloroflexota bacterium]
MLKSQSRLRLYPLLAIAALVLAACGGSNIEQSVNEDAQPVAEEPQEEAAPQESEPLEDPTEVSEESSSAVPVNAESLVENPGEPPRGAESEFATDFTLSTVQFSDILSGGPPKDGIPAVDKPQYISVSEADEWLDDVEPIAVVEVNGEARAFPIQVLMWHEIANAEVGGQAVSVTFCPLCNTAIAFNRELDGLVMDFGTSGRLRFSNLIMYDRQTETWWQQATGEAIVGEQVGKQLEFLPMAMISWLDFKENYADSLVLSRDTGHSRNYGSNPYAGYDDINRSPFLFIGPETPGELPAMARVLTVELGEETIAYPYSVMAEVGVVNDSVDGTELAVFWQPGVASALDAATISSGEDVGAVEVFSRELNGETLSFSFENGVIVDEQTGSEWDVLGRAISGELAGEQLEKLVGINHFWFSWAAFKPETKVYSPEA